MAQELFFDDTAIDTLNVTQRAAAVTLGQVNAQLNGNTKALQELAKDTRLLAAIEQEIAELQKKAMAAETSAMSLAEAVIKVNRGEMTPADFQKNFAKKINSFEKLRAGGKRGIGFC